MEKKPSNTKDLSSREASVFNFGKGGAKENLRTEVTSMDAKPTGVVFSSHDNSHINYSNEIVVNYVDLNNGLEELGSQLPTSMPMQNFVGRGY